jgi:hypothetical protein
MFGVIMVARIVPRRRLPQDAGASGNRVSRQGWMHGTSAAAMGATMPNPARRPASGLQSIDHADLSLVQGGCGKKQRACRCQPVAATAPAPAGAGAEITTNVSLSGFGA